MEYLKQAISFIKLLIKRILRFSIFNFSVFKTRSFTQKLLSIIYSLGLCIFLLILSLELNMFWLFGDMPTMKEARNPKLAVPSEIYSADGKMMGSFLIENRSPVKFEQINQNIIDALIATEDVRFYEHNGVDFRSIGGALVASLSDDNRGGGSTINQQLVKNIYKTRAKSSAGLLGKIPVIKTIVAKLKEWITAIKMNFFFEKDEILTLYLNAVDFGDNTFGIKLASEHFFSKSPENLEVQEAAVLVGVLKATTSYNPARNPERSIQRRNVVLGQMLKYNKIDSTTYQKAIAKPLGIKLKTVTQEESIAPYFIQALKPSLTAWGEENGYNLYADGLKIYTTLDSRAQSYAEKAVKEHLSSIQKSLDQEQGSYKYWFDKNIAKEKAEFKKANPKVKQVPETASEKQLKILIEQAESYKLLIASGKTKDQALSLMEQKMNRQVYTHAGMKTLNISAIDSIKHMAQLLQAGFVSMNPANEHVIAWVGGTNFNFYKYDHVATSSRQPGSSFKPLIYAAALENGYDPCTTIVDKPISFATTINGVKGNWEPKNSSGTYSYGPLPLRKALGRSVNSVAIRILQDIKPKKVIDFTQKMGITSKIEDNLSIALGTSNVKLLELTTAYTVFVDGGILKKPILFTKIENKEGEVVFEEGPSEKKQVMTPKTAYEMTFLLRGSVEEGGGTSRRLYSYGIADQNEIGGKTGTTNDYVDGWYMGITQNLVTGVWVGCENPQIHFTSANGQGGRAALPIFGMYMRDIYKDKDLNIPKSKFTEPEGYVKVNCFNIVLPMPDSTAMSIDSLALDSLGQRIITVDSLIGEE